MKLITMNTLDAKPIGHELETAFVVGRKVTHQKGETSNLFVIYVLVSFSSPI